MSLRPLMQMKILKRMATDLQDTILLASGDLIEIEAKYMPNYT